MNQDRIPEKLYDILRTKFDNAHIKTMDDKGNETMDMGVVRMFSFDFTVKHRNYGPVVLLISANGALEIYYGDNTSKALDNDARKKWQDFIEHMSVFARSNRLAFSLKHTSQLKYDLSNVLDVTECYKKVFEGYYGSSKTSYNKQGKAKIIIRHTKAIGEEDARFRNIEALFVENADGERFKLPFKKLAGARAMARHVTEGGNPYDLFGLHISEMVKDINTLGGFVRKSKAYEELAEAKGLVEAGRRHYNSLRTTLKQLCGSRGYHAYKESWEPSEITEQEGDIGKIRSLFTERSIDSRIEEALPLLAKLEALAEQEDNITEEQKPREEIMSNEYYTLDKWYDVDGTPYFLVINNDTGNVMRKHFTELEKAKSLYDKLTQNREWNSRSDVSGIQDRGGYETMGPMDWMKSKKQDEGMHMDEIVEFEEWANDVVEGVWALPDTSKKIQGLKTWFSEKRPYGIDAINVTDQLYNLVGDDDLFDRLANEAAQFPDNDARSLVKRFLKDKMPDVYAKLFAQKDIENEVEEGLDHELDADNPVKLKSQVNKDLDKYAKEKKFKESNRMKDLKDYIEEVNGTEETEVVTIEPVMESKEEEINLKELMERTNYLLNK